jgi:peptidoglycan hydrolase CwlO-like protein
VEQAVYEIIKILITVAITLIVADAWDDRVKGDAHDRMRGLMAQLYEINKALAKLRRDLKYINGYIDVLSKQIDRQGDRVNRIEIEMLDDRPRVEVEE